ncbi:hypothetical protein MACJ_000490 [Theileria orientalis]|uniref:Uncharacterized protein n=1 Tax=Theileria orientalis TaxID=68886 RepID=A0A976M448_THEOR|nr:hypothetical protein MACJ_000490 [Theileria orientalis]
MGGPRRGVLFSSNLEGSDSGDSDNSSYSYVSSNYRGHHNSNDDSSSTNEGSDAGEGNEGYPKYKLIFVEILPYSDYKINYFYSLQSDDGAIVRQINQTTYNLLLYKMANVQSFDESYIQEIENELANESGYKMSSKSQNMFASNTKSYESEDEDKFSNLNYVDEVEALQLQRNKSSHETFELSPSKNSQEEEPSFVLEYVGPLLDFPNSTATGSGNAPIALKFEPYIPSKTLEQGIIKPKGVVDIIRPELTNNVRYEYEVNDGIPTIFVKASTSKYSMPIQTIYENLNNVWHDDEARMIELKAFSSYGEYKLVELIYQAKSEGKLGVVNYDFDEVVDHDQRLAYSDIEATGPYGETYTTYFKKVNDSWQEVNIREYEKTFNEIKSKIQNVANVMLNLDKMDNADVFFQKYEKGEYFDAFTYFPLTGYTLNMVMDGDAIIWRSKNKRCVAVIVIREPAFDRGVDLSFQGYGGNVVVGNGSSVSGSGIGGSGSSSNSNTTGSSGTDLGPIRFIKLELLGTGGSSSTKRTKSRCYKKLESDDIPIGKAVSDGDGIVRSDSSSSGGSYEEENTLRLSRRYVRITDAEFEGSINGELELNFKVRLPMDTSGPSDGSKEGKEARPLTRDSLLLDKIMDRANMVDGPGRVEDTSTKCDTATTTTCSRVAARNRIIHLLPRKGAGGELPPTAKLFKQEEDGISFDSSITFGQVHEEPEDRPVNLMEEEDIASVSSAEKVQRWLEGGVKAGQIENEEDEWSFDDSTPAYGDLEYDQNRLEDYQWQGDHDHNVYEQSWLEATESPEAEEGGATPTNKHGGNSAEKSRNNQAETPRFEKMLLDVVYYKKFTTDRHNGVQYKTFMPPDGKMFTTLCSAGHVIWRAQEGESCDFVRVFFPDGSPQMGFLRMIDPNSGEGVDFYFLKEGDEWKFVTSEHMVNAFKVHAIGGKSVLRH